MIQIERQREIQIERNRDSEIQIERETGGEKTGNENTADYTERDRERQ